MSEHAKHTPWPWTLVTNPSERNVTVYGKGRQHVATVWSGRDCELDVALANARLIISVEKLIKQNQQLAETLRDLVNENEGYGSSVNPSELAWTNARAALRAVEVPTNYPPFKIS